jgi:uncharacterized protein (TIGR04255 family)
MTETHSKSPLHETLLHLVFMPQSNYDITFPGIFFNEIKEDYPEKVDKSIGAISVPRIEDGSKSIDGDLTVFKSKDGKRQLQLGKDILIINISDYYNWGSWKKEVTRIIELYSNIRGQEIQLRQVGLGFMNKFDISADKLMDVLNFELPIPKDEEYSEVLSASTQINFPRGDDVLTQHFRTITNDNDDEIRFIIELSYARNKPLTLSFGEEFDQWLEKAHDEIKMIFSKSVTQQYLNEIA